MYIVKFDINGSYYYKLGTFFNCVDAIRATRLTLNEAEQVMDFFENEGFTSCTLENAEVGG